MKHLRICWSLEASWCGRRPWAGGSPCPSEQCLLQSGVFFHAVSPGEALTVGSVDDFTGLDQGAAAIKTAWDGTVG